MTIPPHPAAGVRRLFVSPPPPYCRTSEGFTPFSEYVPERSAHFGKLPFCRDHKKHGKQSGGDKKEDKMPESAQQNSSECRTADKTQNHQNANAAKILLRISRRQNDAHGVISTSSMQLPRKPPSRSREPESEPEFTAFPMWKESRSIKIFQFK